MLNCSTPLNVNYTKNFKSPKTLVKVKIHLNYLYGESFFSYFKIFLSAKRRIYIKLATLKLLFKNKTNFFFILSTSQGLLSHKAALKKNITGFLLMIVYL